MKEYSIPLTSITYAIKAQNALRARGIRSTITRDERYASGASCGYALALPTYVDRGMVLEILRQEHIKLAEPYGG